jgi:hypothetical protein
MGKTVTLGPRDNDRHEFDIAFKTALEKAGHGGTVLLPGEGGPFRVTRPIEVPYRGISIIGAGRHSQIKARFTAPDQPVMELRPDGPSHGVRLVDFLIGSDQIGQGDTKYMPAQGIVMKDQHNFDVRGVFVEGPPQGLSDYGFVLKGCYSGAIYGCASEHCEGALDIGRSDNGQHGSNNVTVTSLVTSGLNGIGLLIGGSHSIQLIGCELNMAEALDQGGDTGVGKSAIEVRSANGAPSRAISIVGGLYAATQETILVGNEVEHQVDGFSLTGAIISGLESHAALNCVNLQNVVGAVIQGNLFQHYKTSGVYLDPKCRVATIGANAARKNGNPKGPLDSKYIALGRNNGSPDFVDRYPQ